MKIYTIIVTYNAMQRNWIDRCMESLSKSTIRTIPVLIDNGEVVRVKSFFSVAAVITYYYIVCTRWKSVGIKCVGEVELRGQYAVRCLKLRVGLMVQCLLSRLRVIFERYRKISVSDVRIVRSFSIDSYSFSPGLVSTLMKDRLLPVK